MVFSKEYPVTHPKRLQSLRDLQWKRQSLESLISSSDWRSGTPSPTGHRECFACKLPIFDLPEVFALSKRWHRDCFNCSQCSKQLSVDNYYDVKGKPYCEADYNYMFYSKCYACSKTIFEAPLKVLHRTYHPLCFTCKKCSQPICHFNFLERNGSYYCERDYHDLFSPKCRTCQLPIKDQKEMTIAMGSTFHKEHFVCYECAQPLPGHNFRKMGGEVYCENDYHKLFSPRCDTCDEPIRHNGILALGKKFHRDCCLRCGACQKILREDNYIQVNDKAYCKSDWKKLFAPKCDTCKRPISQALTGDSVIALGKEYHPECFICKRPAVKSYQECNGNLDQRSFYEVDNEPYCYQHFHNKTCVDCIKVKHEKATQARKIINNSKANSTITRRSMSPIDFLFRPKSSAF